METEVLMEQMCQAVREAGELIRSCTFEGEMKAKAGSANFVTKYDSMVQNFLIKKLTALVPDAAFIGEEDGYSEGKIAEGKTFIIDPIDGTTNFICGFPVCGICVGLAEWGIVEIGVVYNPYREELFAARRGGGAYLNGKPLAFLDHSLKEGVLCMDTAPYTPEIRKEIFERLLKLSHLCMDMRSIGSAALSICYVACGRSAAYLSPRLCVWDYAAASVILTEAGGVITGWDGKDLELATGVSVLAGAPKAYKEVMDSTCLESHSELQSHERS